MANENVFEKEYVDQREKNNLEGLLEQFNVPPGAITFIRRHQRSIQIILAVFVCCVVAWALYDSHLDKKVKNSGNALSVAQNLEGEQLVAALEQVALDFSGTDSALWAEVGIARELARSGKTEEANSRFTALLPKVDKNSALKPLLELSIAQTSEALGDFDGAVQRYELLKDIEGYQTIGYGGLGRLQEIQGNKEAALTVYEEQLGALSGSTNPAITALVEEKIARIKASQ